MQDKGLMLGSRSLDWQGTVFTMCVGRAETKPI